MRFLSIVTYLLALLLLAAPAHAQGKCDCSKKSSLQDSYNDASLVFVGRAESVKRSPLRSGQSEISFIVFERVKNQFDESKSGKVVIYTPESMEQCGFSFVMEQDYLVFATGNPAAYRVSLCSPTELIDAARDRLEKIKRFK